MTTATLEAPVGPAFKRTHPPKLDAVASQIWGEVREHTHSLDSQRWIELIKDALLAQEEAYHNSVDYYHQQAQVADKEAKKAKAIGRKAALRVDALEAQLELLEGRLQLVNSQLGNSKAKVSKLLDKYEPKEEPKVDPS